MFENNIKRNCVEIYYEDVAWNYLTQKRAMRRDLTCISSDNDVSGSVKREGETFLNGCGTTSFFNSVQLE